MTDPNDPNDQKKKALYDALGAPVADPVAPPPTTPLAAPGFATGENVPGAAPVPAAPKAPNTNGYDAPKYQPTGPTGPMAGWDAGKLADTSHQSPKYAVGRILSEAGAPSVENLDKAFARIEEAYPGAQRMGRDKVRMPDGGVVDVLTNSGAGENMGWAWQPETGPGGAPLEGESQAMPMGMGLGGMPMQGVDPLLSGDPFAKIQEELAKLTGPRNNAQALMSSLTGGR